jgi:hypothetical protein
MGKTLKYTAALILAAFIGFMYVMNEESFFANRNKFDLFNSYLKRASDTNEKQLRLVDNRKVVQDGMRGKQTVTTLMFVDQKYYLRAFSKTYKLLLTREANIDNHDLDWIEAGLYLDVDYGVRKEHEVIFITSKVGKKDAYWNVLNSLYDNPVNSARKKISEKNNGNGPGGGGGK